MSRAFPSNLILGGVLPCFDYDQYPDYGLGMLCSFKISYYV